jgi:hypothetical protein
LTVTHSAFALAGLFFISLVLFYLLFTAIILNTLIGISWLMIAFKPWKLTRAKLFLFLVILPLAFIIIYPTIGSIILALFAMFSFWLYVGLIVPTIIIAVITIVLAYIIASSIANTVPLKAKTVTIVLLVIDIIILLLLAFMVFFITKPYKEEIVKDSPAPGCVVYKTSGVRWGGLLRCNGKAIIYDFSYPYDIPCLSIQPDNCWGGTIKIRSDCAQDITVNDLILKYQQNRTVTHETFIKLYSENGSIHVANPDDYRYDSDWRTFARKDGVLRAQGQVANESFDIEIRKSDAIVPEIDCLQINLGIYGGVPSTLFIKNYCPETVTIEGVIIPPYEQQESYNAREFEFELYKDDSGVTRARQASRDSIKYNPDSNETLYATITVGSWSSNLSYTKSTRLC